ncbi:MATE family efflux transporter [Alienimonas californiensis]|uniref:Multidrug-efflux transporter n=1 Tax=Alienimonas californiensis TaxID=2527989 RepID=A0A517PBX5_9PLAN|nr:MATE family efflux transporter [Alienimonas californiensis]QDT16884.1 Multidrug resistance protein NorM [Alienimonas californiensis]
MPLHAAVLTLAWPVLGEQILGFGVGLFDTWLSGRISSGATAAVGLAAYVAWLATMLFGVVSVGATAIVARHWGAGETARANAVANRVLGLGLIAGGLYYALIWPLAPYFAAGLRLEGETFDIAVRYLRIDGLGQVITAMSLAGFAALRGAGDMTTPLILGAGMNLLNAAASWAFVYGVEAIGLPACGANGIVYGTVAARTFGGLALLATLASGSTRLRLLAAELLPDRATTARVLKIGLPAAVDGAIRWAGHFVFLALIAGLPLTAAAGVGSAADDDGETTFAAHIVAVRLEAITYLPSVAWGAAAATIVGQSLGAKRLRRAKAVGHVAAGQCAALGALISALFLLAAEPLVGFMHLDPAVRAEAAPALRALALCQIPLTGSIVYVTALRGAGETRVPLLLTLAGMYGLRLPLAWVGGVWLGWGLPGAYLGMFGDVAFRATAGGIWYRVGGWWRKEV